MAPVRFSSDIRPLFRDYDIEEMNAATDLDLSKYEEVKEYSKEILQRLEIGQMPCDGAWPDEKIATFKKWIDEGMAP